MAKGKIILKEHSVGNGSLSSKYEEDEYWSHEKFVERLNIKMRKLTKLEMEVDLIGVSCSIANAIRRVLLSEVPSMAIEKVYVSNNTSLIKDEVLAHRLGLVPLRADSRLFDFSADGFDEANEQSTLVYELKVKCTSKVEGDKNSCDPDDKYNNHSVYTKQLRWIPLGGQASLMKEKDVGPVHSDILLDKLRPGQELDLKVFAVKGTGGDHAKFSPVATAYYRMHPKIELLRDVIGEAAGRLERCFSPGVIGIEKTRSGEDKAVVLDARNDSCSRNIFQHEDLKDAVEMSRIQDHFIFHVESVGALRPDELFMEAIELLRKKCHSYLQELSDKAM